jgi:hypothetical protein
MIDARSNPKGNAEYATISIQNVAKLRARTTTYAGNYDSLTTLRSCFALSDWQ